MKDTVFDIKNKKAIVEACEAARYNSGKPMLSFIDFNMWKDTLDSMPKYIHIDTKEECLENILWTMSSLTSTNDGYQHQQYLSNLKFLTYRLALLYKDIPLTDSILLDLRGFQEMANVLEFGAKKYERNNWRKGYNNKFSAADSLLRHVGALMIGEEKDLESGLHHIGHIMCNVMFLTNDLLFIVRQE